MKSLRGGIVIVFGLVLILWGLQAIPNGSVAGGNGIWVLFFGGSLVLVATGLFDCLKRTKSN